MNHLARTAGRAKSVVAQPLIAASLAASSLSRLFSSTSLHQNSSTSVDELIQQRSNEDASTAAELRKEDINRLLYRARQRGWLELDLIIGRWAKRNLEEESQALPRSVIRDLELLLTQENPDLFKWLTGQLPTPSEMLQNSAFRMIKADLDRGIEINGSPKASTPAGTAWVRGWGDTGTTPSGSSAPFERGNQE